jgi:hypothetical protein
VPHFPRQFRTVRPTTNPPAVQGTHPSEDVARDVTLPAGFRTVPEGTAPGGVTTS